ncbi:MAG: hypothetical protein ACR2QE_16230 [Acidimicrobiales bacterium]
MSDDDRPLDPRGRPIPTAALASNWWVVLLADAGLGVLGIGIGLGVALWWTPWVGAPLMAVGAVYLLFVVRRGLQWRWMRREAAR